MKREWKRIAENGQFFSVLGLMAGLFWDLGDFETLPNSLW